MEIVISDTNMFIDLWNIGLLVYHQYSIPTILQVVTPISFLKKIIFAPHRSIALRLSPLE